MQKKIQDRLAPSQADRLPSLKAISYFASAARLQSFTGAAKELHITQAAVSRMVQTLEEELGVQLFDRKGRWICLNAAGEVYYKRVSEGLSLISSASNLVRRSGDSGNLTLVVNRGFATLWLVRQLADFGRLYPNIRITLLDDEGAPNGIGNPAEIMIRFGSPPWPGEVAVRLLKGSTIGVVCAPGLLSGSRLSHPIDLARLPILSYAGGRYDRWGEFFGNFGLPPPDLERGMRFYQLLALREAAISGLGVALVPLFLFTQELATGLLIKAIPQTMEASDGYYITHAKGADRRGKIRSFKRWLLSRIRTHTDFGS